MVVYIVGWGWRWVEWPLTPLIVGWVNQTAVCVMWTGPIITQRTRHHTHANKPPVAQSKHHLTAHLNSTVISLELVLSSLLFFYSLQQQSFTPGKKGGEKHQWLFLFLLRVRSAPYFTTIISHSKSSILNDSKSLSKLPMFIIKCIRG